MEFSNYIQKIYCGKSAVFNHISLFSLLGILTIAVNNYLSSAFGNIFGTYLENVRFSPTVNYLNLFLALMLVIFFCGYGFKYVWNMFNGEYSLPELSLSSYTIFLRMLPLFIVWSIYTTFMAFLGLVFFPINSPLFSIYFSVLICLIPFILIIMVSFARNFEYKPFCFNLFSIFSVLNKALGDVIFLFLKTVVASILPAVVVYAMYKSALISNHQTVIMSLKLGALCVAVYSLFVLSCAFNIGLVQISKEKFSDLN